MQQKRGGVVPCEKVKYIKIGKRVWKDSVEEGHNSIVNAAVIER
jgi:hypothetical protein